jgi:hypothetical protein
MAVGFNCSSQELDSYLADLGVREGDYIDFPLFFDWWTSDMGAAIAKRSAK